MDEYRCSRCGQMHKGPPFNYGAAESYYYLIVPENERRKRCKLSSDLCVVDDEFFFILGNIEIPVAGSPNPFSWGVWVSLKEENYQRAVSLWDKPGRENEPPYFGWLNSALPLYLDTVGLKTNVHTRQVGMRPFVELEPTNHLLAVEQREGITQERVRQIAEMLLHPDSSTR